MKTVAGILLLFFVINVLAETVTLNTSGFNESQPISIQSNQVARVTYWGVTVHDSTDLQVTSLSSHLKTKNGTTTNEIVFAHQSHDGWTVTPAGFTSRTVASDVMPILKGPMEITLDAASASINPDVPLPATAICTFEITTETPEVGAIPPNTVVIPSDTNGPVTIVLESSVDLVTWTAANPGTYGTTTSNRFFRVRAVR